MPVILYSLYSQGTTNAVSYCEGPHLKGSGKKSKKV